MRLTKGEIAEIKDLAGKTWADCRQLAKIFNVTPHQIAWHINYKNIRNRRRVWTYAWRDKNPEKWDAIVKKAQIKYHKTDYGKQRMKEYYQKNRHKWPQYDPNKIAKYKAYQRQYYLNKKLCQKDFQSPE